MTSNIRTKNIYEAIMLKNKMAESRRQKEIRENTKFFQDSEVRARQEKRWTSENFFNNRREKLRSLLKAEVNFFEVKTIQPFERFIQGLLNHLSESTSPVDFSSTGQFNYPVSENGFMQKEQEDCSKNFGPVSASSGEFYSEIQKNEQVLQQKVEELKHFDAETEELDRREKEILEYQKNLRQLLNDRKDVVESRLRKRLEKVLLRQQAAALRRRSRQVQEELSSDLAWLDRLFALEGEGESCGSQLNSVREVLKEVLQREKIRESDFDDLVSSELAELAKKREHEWKREAEAREKLLNDVVLECQERAKSRMKALRSMRSEREEKYSMLMREVEVAKQSVPKCATPQMHSHTNNYTPDAVEPVRSSHLRNSGDLHKETTKEKENAKFISVSDHEKMNSDTRLIEPAVTNHRRKIPIW